MLGSLHLFAASSALSLFTLGATPLRTSCTLPVGGPPRIAICGKGSGEVSRAALTAQPDLVLQGCVPGVRIVAFSFTCSKAKGQTIAWRTRESRLSEQMLKTISALPIGASFTITELDVVDEKGVAYKVPDATYVLVK